MRDSVWVRAAQQIALTEARYRRGNGRIGCCSALREANATLTERWEFARVFAQKHNSKGFWWSVPFSDDAGWNDQQARVLALLFMHHMTEGDSDA